MRLRRATLLGVPFVLATGTACNVFDSLEPPALLIGASLPLTGELGEFGTDITTGLELAVEVVNGAGGLLSRDVGRRLELVVLDDATTEAGAVSNVRALIERGAFGIVGPLTSSQALATESITHDAGIVQVSPTAGAPELSCAQPPVDRYFFRTVSQVRNGSAGAIALFAEAGPIGGRPCTRMAILHSSDAVGVAYLEAVRDLFEVGGGTIVATIDFPPEELVDYGPVVAELTGSTPDCAVLVALPTPAIQILSEFAEQVATFADPSWEDFFWVGTTALHGTSFVEANARHPGQPGDGVFVADEDTAPPTLEYGELRDLYNAYYGRATGEDLAPFVSNSYDALVLLALAVEHAGTAHDRSLVRDGVWGVTGVGPERVIVGPSRFDEGAAALADGRPIHYKGASSQLTLDEYGATFAMPSIIWRLDDGAFVVVTRYSDDDLRDRLTHAPGPAAPCDP